MKRLILMLTLLFALPTMARPSAATRKEFTEVKDWQQFDQFMQEQTEQDRRLGWSYVISGALVTGGGLIAASSATDTGTQLILGISTSLGLAAASYGVIHLLNGNEYNSVYESIRKTKLSPAQRDEFIRYYTEEQRERQRVERITGMVTHFVAGGLNLYSASRQDDKNAKTFLQFFAAVNFALGLSYTF